MLSHLHFFVQFYTLITFTLLYITDFVKHCVGLVGVLPNCAGLFGGTLRAATAVSSMCLAGVHIVKYFFLFVMCMQERACYNFVLATKCMLVPRI